MSRVRIVIALTALLGVSLPSSAAVTGSRPLAARLEHVAGGAAREVNDLLSGRSPLASLPDDFEEVMGYRPSVRRLADGTLRALKPTGVCSSVLGATRFGFTPICKAHDFGYDLLRYAEHTGRPLGASARRLLDAMFEHDIHSHCETTAPEGSKWACHALATIYEEGAQFNSWRQRYGVP